MTRRSTIAIANLPVAVSLDGSEYTIVEQGEVTRRAQVGLIANFPTDGAQDANTVLAGPTTGSAAAATFRELVSADLGQGSGGTSGYLLGTDGTDPTWVGFTQTGTGALARTWASKAKETLSILDFIPEAEHAAILNFTSTTDVRTYVNNALTAGNAQKKIILAPAGLYCISDFVGADSMSGTGIIGQGGRDMEYGTSTLVGTIFKYTNTTAANTGDIFTLTNGEALHFEEFQVCYVSNNFEGTFFNCNSNTSVGHGNLFRRVSCYQITNNGLTAARCWYLRNNVDVTFEQCYASHAAAGWVGLLDADVGETNIIKLFGCTSIGLTGPAIINPKIGWSLYSHNFELGNGGIPSGIAATGSHTVTKLSLFDCTGADATVAGTWIDLPVVVSNFNFISGGLFGDGVANINGFLFGAASNCILIQGARLVDLAIGATFSNGSATTGVTICANNLTGTDTPISGFANLDPGTTRLFSNIPGVAASDNAGNGFLYGGLWLYESGGGHVMRILQGDNLTDTRDLTIVLGDANRSLTLGGNITTGAAVSTTGALTTGGAFTTAGAASLPAIVQGDLWYGSAAGVISALAKDANATRYLSNTGGSNNPAWAQVALTTGVSGVLPIANGGVGFAGPAFFSMAPVSVNVEGTGDTTLTVTLPTGYTRYRLSGFTISDATADLSASTQVIFEVRTDSGGGGTALTASTNCTVTNNTANTSANAQFVSPSISVLLSDTTLHFRVTTGKGSAATCNVTTVIHPYL